MPSSYTPNYNLNQWEPDDRVLRTDFNADNLKIDAALGALSAGLSGRLGRMEVIQNRNSDGTTNSGVGYDPPRINWDEWEYVCLLAQYPGQTPAGTTPLSFIFVFNDGGTISTNTITPLALPGYLVVLLPRHGKTSKTEGFVLSDRFTPFSIDHPLKTLDQVSFDLKEYNQRLTCPNISYFGGK